MDIFRKGLHGLPGGGDIPFSVSLAFPDADQQTVLLYVGYIQAGTFTPAQPATVVECQHGTASLSMELRVLVEGDFLMGGRHKLRYFFLTKDSPGFFRNLFVR